MAMLREGLILRLIQVNIGILKRSFNDPMKWLKFLFRSALVSLLMSGLPGCESGTGVESGGEFTGQQSETTVTGRYQLVEVNGETVPALVAHRYAEIKVHSGDFTIRADGSCSTTSVFSPPDGGMESRKSHGSWEKAGDKLTMQWLGAGKTVAILAGERLTMDNHGMDFVYQRTQPISSLEQFDLASECDQSVIEAGVSRAQAGVFDDFEQGLISGRNADGVSIGFLTFQDSQTTRIAMSTTGKHPPRPNESNDNSVLQLDLDVRAWAGIIHGFENGEVNRWTPRDWRDMSELRFWFYGNNRQTTLFVEVLDNRRPCPSPAGAEVYTYQFTDDFSGWKQMIVPFEQFRRKEIYNDAPNDGLGLGEVHGWAFGALDTGGPTTYYLDDFEIR